MSGETASGCGIPEEKMSKPKEITIQELCDAILQENKNLHERINNMERRLYRYDRIFESAFKQEAEERLSLSSNQGVDQCATAMGPIARLKYR